MRIRALKTPVALLALIVMTVVALRAADDKSKVKDSDVPPPGTIKFTSAPPAVQKLFKDQTNNTRIDLLGKGTNEDKTSYYKAMVPIGKYDYVMAVHQDGTLLEKILNASRTEDIKLEDCPPAVQKALREDSKSAKIEAIVRVTAGKRSDYFIDITEGTKPYQVIFTEEGILVSKMIIDPADEEPAANDVKKTTEKPEKPASTKKR